MELFRLGDSLMINELAPRVHNTGHWTQAGSSISQFEYHVRAVAGYPVIPSDIKAPSVMINLIGTPWDERWLSVPGAEVYWYGKEHRSGRKLGHINFCNSNIGALTAQLDQLQTLLPSEYEAVLDWTRSNLNSKG
jgi:5-(carboxyamino)imidazole ribonucleotide synthase